MLKDSNPIQQSAEFVFIEDLVPENHLLRKIEKTIDFSFIREKVKHLYCCDNGRPAIDPVILFKILFIGYFFGIKSERQLMKEVEVNLAYRWFLGFNLTDKVPNHSTLSQNRRRRFSESMIYQEIFDEIVFKAIERNFIDGTTLFTDSTHIKANANKHKFKKEFVAPSILNYLEELEKDVNKDRLDHNKEPLNKKLKKKLKRKIK